MAFAGVTDAECLRGVSCDCVTRTPKAASEGTRGFTFALLDEPAAAHAFRAGVMCRNFRALHWRGQFDATTRRASPMVVL